MSICSLSFSFHPCLWRTKPFAHFIHNRDTCYLLLPLHFGLQKLEKLMRSSIKYVVFVKNIVVVDCRTHWNHMY